MRGRGALGELALKLKEDPCLRQAGLPSVGMTNIQTRFLELVHYESHGKAAPCVLRRALHG